MTRGIYNWTAEDTVRFLKAHGFVLNHTIGNSKRKLVNEIIVKSTPIETD